MTAIVASADDFARWLKSRDRCCVYYAGNLADEATWRHEVRALAIAAYAAALDRKVYLVQRRPQPGIWSLEYLAVKPDGGKVPERFAPCAMNDRDRAMLKGHYG